MTLKRFFLKQRLGLNSSVKHSLLPDFFPPPPLLFIDSGHFLLTPNAVDVGQDVGMWGSKSTDLAHGHAQQEGEGKKRATFCRGNL